MSTIADFYAHRDVLVTGATGFLGKVLVEKLLRACPLIGRIYVLIRSKNGQDGKERFLQLQNSMVFDSIRHGMPDALQKLTGIYGDVTETDCGLTAEDQETLIQNVAIVFNCAATVKFSEDLRTAVRKNVVSMMNVVSFCEKMHKLAVLVHVSTAYCHCQENTLDETVKIMSPSPNQLIEALKWMDDETVRLICPTLLEGRPNTYTYTKALAESLLKTEVSNLPIAIVRPSIINATWKEPVPGWVDCLHGNTGFILGGMKGVLRSVYCNSDHIVDVVPVDICCNLMIAAAWDTATIKHSDIMVYNCASGEMNSHTWDDFIQQCTTAARTTPVSNVLWYPTVDLVSSRLQHEFNSLFVHWLPALILDLVSICLGKKAIMLKLHYKIQQSMSWSAFFAVRQWIFKTHNMWKIWKRMSEGDKKDFNFDIRQVNWPTFYWDYCLGVRKYILKEDLSTLENARKRLQRMYYVRQLCVALGFTTLGLLARSLIKYITN